MLPPLVVMSAFSDYEGAVNMFNASIRTVEFQILIVLGTDTFNCFQSVLTVWDRNRTKNAILAYRISLAWGATAGYARAVQYLTAELNKTRFKGPSGGSIMGCIAKLGDMGVNLPPQFRADELEARAGGTARDVGLTGLPLPAAGSSHCSGAYTREACWWRRGKPHNNRGFLCQQSQPGMRPPGSRTRLTQWSPFLGSPSFST